MVSNFIQQYQKSIIKAFFFLVYASAAVWLSFFYVYLKDGAGLTGIEVGVIAGLQQFNNLFVLPVWGNLADRYGRKRMLLIAIGATIILLPFFLLLKGAFLLIGFMVVVTLMYNPVASLVDTIALDYQEQSEGKTSYGEIRLWASVGWGTASFVAGMLIHKSNLHLIFPVAALMFLLTWVLLLFFYKPLKVHHHLETLQRGKFMQVLKTEKVLLAFYLLVFMYSIFSAPIYLILNVYYLDIGASNSLIGLAFLVQGLFEIPFFFFGKRFVDRYGAKKVFLFAMLATALRMLGYGLTGNPFVAVAIGAVHGISIGLFFVSVVSFVHGIVPAQYRTSGQAYFYTFYAVGVAIGNLLTGVLMDYYSMRMTMIWNAAGIMVLVLLVLLTKRLFRKIVG